MTLAAPTDEELTVLADALDAFQAAERYGAGLLQKDDPQRAAKYDRARLASKLLTEVERA